MAIGGGPDFTDAELVDFSPFKNISTSKPTPLPDNMWGSVANLVGDQVIACGGAQEDNCYAYDFDLHTWTHAATMDTARYGAVGFVSAVDDKWFILGGNAYGIVLDTAIVYQQDNGFTEGGKLPHQVYFPCLATVNETHVFLAGGYGGDGIYYSDAHLLEVATWTWTEVAGMGVARYEHSCGRVGRDIVAVGGYQEDARRTSEIFNLGILAWRYGPGVPGESGEFYDAGPVYQLEDTFFTLGGYGGGSHLDYVYEFDPVTFAWKERRERLVVARSHHAVVPVLTRLLVKS